MSARAFVLTFQFHKLMTLDNRIKFSHCISPNKYNLISPIVEYLDNEEKEVILFLIYFFRRALNLSVYLLAIS